MPLTLQGKSDEWATFKTYLRAFVAMYGSVFFWLGLWTIFDIDIWPTSASRNALYMLVGGVAMVLSDNFYR